MSSQIVYAEGMAQPAYDPDYDPAAVSRAIRVAQDGNVIYLYGHQEDVALMPANLAKAALQALEDAEDAEDVAVMQASAARRARGEVGLTPHEQVMARYAKELTELQALEANEQAQ